MVVLCVALYWLFPSALPAVVSPSPPPPQPKRATPRARQARLAIDMGRRAVPGCLPTAAYLPAAGLYRRLYEVNSNNPQPIISYDGHAGNVTSLGFQKDGKWMYSGSEDGTGEPTAFPSPAQPKACPLARTCTTAPQNHASVHACIQRSSHPLCSARLLGAPRCSLLAVLQ